MNNRELEELLKSARVPERTEDYWRDFPGRVSAELKRKSPSAGLQKSSPERLLLIWGLGLATMVILIGLLVKFPSRHAPSADGSNLDAARKCYHELESLFPNQLKAIVFDELGPRMVLSDRADVPDSIPLYLRICGPGGCQRFVTFSGQKITVNGEQFEVLEDAQGKVIVMGNKRVWVGGNDSGPIRIQSKPLESVM